MKERLNRIDYYKTLLLAKAAILPSYSGPDNREAMTAAIEEYNKVLALYQDSVHPYRIAERDDYLKKHKKILTKVSNAKTLKNLIGKDAKLNPQDKIEGNYRMSINEKNWSRVNG